MEEKALNPRTAMRRAFSIACGIFFGLGIIFAIIDWLNFQSIFELLHKESESAGDSIGYAIGVMILIILWGIGLVCEIICGGLTIGFSIPLLVMNNRRKLNVTYPVIALSIGCMLIVSAILAVCLLN